MPGWTRPPSKEEVWSVRGSRGDSHVELSESQQKRRVPLGGADANHNLGGTVAIHEI